VERFRHWLAAISCLVVGAASFALSYVAISEVSADIGAVPGHLAWLVPIAIDGGIMCGSAIIWSASRRGATRPKFAYVFTAAMVITSVIINAHHAADILLAQTIAALPPLILLGTLELVASQGRSLAAATVASQDADQPATGPREVRATTPAPRASFPLAPAPAMAGGDLDHVPAADTDRAPTDGAATTAAPTTSPPAATAADANPAEDTADGGQDHAPNANHSRHGAPAATPETAAQQSTPQQTPSKPTEQTAKQTAKKTTKKTAKKTTKKTAKKTAKKTTKKTAQQPARTTTDPADSDTDATRRPVRVQAADPAM